MKEDLKTIMADVLQIPIGEIGESTSMETVDSWDSLRHMELVQAIEGHFRVEFAAEEALEMTSVEGIKRILATKALQS